MSDDDVTKPEHVGAVPAAEMTDGDTTPNYAKGQGAHFAVAEFASHDGFSYPPAWIADRWAKLARTLDVIREAWGKPLRVLSGYRSVAHNTEVGGAKASQHMEGRAADIRPLGYMHDLAGAVAELHALTLTLWNTGKLPDLGGLGVYLSSGWIHVDTRDRVPRGHLAQWTGNGIGSEQT